MATLIALVLMNADDTPNRTTQRVGDLVAKEADGRQENIMFVFGSGHHGPTLYDIMTGFGPTASFTPDQITTLTGLYLPDPERFVRLGALIAKNEAPDNPHPRKVMGVIADAEFIKAFLRHYFTVVAKEPTAATLNDFVIPGTVIVLETETNHVRVLQAPAQETVATTA